MSKFKQINQIKREIKEKLKQGISKTQIEQDLVSKYEGEYVKRILKNYPEPEAMKKYRVLNNILITLIVFIILLKIYLMYTQGIDVGDNKNASSMWIILFTNFIFSQVIIPVFVIRYLKSYEVWGYLISILLPFAFLKTFMDSGNEMVVFQAVILIAIFLLSLFLYKKVHPNYKIFHLFEK